MKRIAVITGASSGLGSEFARQLAGLEGALRPEEIWLVARRRDRLEALAAELKGAKGVVIEADLSGPEGTAVLAARLRAEPVELTCFVNNAGFGTYGPFLDTELPRMLEEIDLNIRTLTELSHIAASLMKPGARLVNVASLAAFQPLGNFAVYAATKAYVHHFSLALAAELHPRGIVVTSLCPGPVATEFSKVASAGAREHVHGGKSAERVVAVCLRDARRGKWTSLPYFSWKATTLLVRLLPKALIARGSFAFMKRPSASAGR